MDNDMTLDPGLSRQLRDWLHETANELPDDPALLGRIRAERATSRRSVRLPMPWRSLRLATASAVVVIVVVATGLALRTPPSESRLGVAGATAEPAHSASLKTLPSVSSDEAPGRYRVDPTWLALGDELEVSLDLPAGWDISNGIITSNLAGTTRVAEAELDLFVIDRIYSDPCAHDGLVEGSPWASLDSFAGSLGAWSVPAITTNPVVSAPRFHSFGIHPGFELHARIPTDLDVRDCTDAEYRLWQYADGSSPRVALPGDELLIRVIAPISASPDASSLGDPRRSGLLTIVATTRPGTPLEIRQELLDMADSVHIKGVSGGGG